MKKELNEKEKNYVRNYFLLAILFVGCIALTLYFCKCYQVYQEYQKEIPVIRGSLLEITKDDLEHYIVDNSNVITYLCTANEDSCRNFEKDFKKYIAKNGIDEQVVYLNLTGIDQEEFVKEFNDKYPYKNSLDVHYPAFVVFEDGRVTSILQGTKKKELTLSSVEQFLELNSIEEEEEEIEETIEEE